MWVIHGSAAYRKGRSAPQCRQFLRCLREVLGGVDGAPVGTLGNREAGQAALAGQVRERGALVVAALGEQVGEPGEKTYTPALISYVVGGASMKSVM